MRTFLSINTTVPAEGCPGTPVIVYYDNGDWEIAFFGNVDYIESGNSNFVGYVSAIEFVTELRLLNDFDPVDTDGEVAHLYVEAYTDVGTVDEAVLVLFEAEDSFIVERETADNLVDTDDDCLNFIPIVELLEELRSFVSVRRDEMFGDFDDIPSLYGDDEDGEDD